MSVTRWINEITGRPLDRTELCSMRSRAHDLYLRNTHIFEDELDALAALGAIPARDIADAV